MKLTFPSCEEPPKKRLPEADRSVPAITPIKAIQFARMAASNTLERDSGSVGLNAVDKIPIGPDSQS